ncbi:hypothetical protein HS125_20090 [bacterium]|nr:hypothetical protein [bacterium]
MVAHVSTLARAMAPAADYACYPLGFAVSARARRQLEFDAIVAGAESEAAAGRLLAERLRARAAARDSSPPIYASEITTLGVLWDILRFLIDHYVLDEQPGALTRGVYWAGVRQGWETPERSVAALVELFPPEEVARGERSARQLLDGHAGRHPGRDLARASRDIRGDYGAGQLPRLRWARKDRN